LTETNAPKPTPKPAPPAVPKPRPTARLREGASIKDLAERFKLRPRDLADKLTAKGYTLNITDIIDPSLAVALAKDLNIILEIIPVEDAYRRESEAKAEDMIVRPPVVTIMGHVDHGKTTLLDAIRRSKLVDKESGGITQHIGAYQVTFNKKAITFIDTPGHEAFTQLRARGAKVTDIVILVVAAEEGLMPQTREAINHAKAAGVPLLVAINKIDKPEANPDRVKRELQKDGLLIEEWGGAVICVEISAKERKNIPELLDMILLMADVLDLKANPKAPAQGVVLEARLDPKKGPLATVIIQTGTLHAGDAFLSGTTFGKVRAMTDDLGRAIKTAGPSTPVEVLGFSDVPGAGDLVQILPGLEEARVIAEQRRNATAKIEPLKQPLISLDDLFRKVEAGGAKELSLIVRADVQGSLEVLLGLLPSLSTDKVKIRIVHAATGSINESDIILAKTTQSVILGYNIKPTPKIQELAVKEKVEVRTYKIIYQLTDELKKAVTGLLEPVIKETFLGRAQVRKIFRIPKVGTIAGCYVQEGRIARNAEIRVLRGKDVVHKGKLSSLKHVKENVNEVKAGYECGLGLANFKDIQEGDLLEAFITEKVAAI
jgi:translation initiation factor IF-2